MVDLEDTGNSTSVRLIGSYYREDLIGQGGFGKVYKARHHILGSNACIKVIHPDQRGDNLAVLVREAEVLTKLDHPNIVRVLDLTIEDDNQIALLLEYIDGGDLLALLKSVPGPFALEDAVKILDQVAAGLQYVHQQNIIHRDLKPQNILRKKSGDVVIADFGLAKVRDNVRSQNAQSSGIDRAGTPYYMAPEHWDGKAEYRSDLYSLGIIAYQLLTKHLPFTGNLTQVRVGHCKRKPPSLCEINPKIFPEIEQVVLKMLEKDPEKRYQTALDFARDLRRALIFKTLKPLPTDPGRFQVDLANIAEDRMMSLAPGDYTGPFTLDKGITLMGAGQTTKLYAIDEAVLRIQAAGVRLENLVIQRTHESKDEPVIEADEQVSYMLKQVTIQGGKVAGASWEGAEWQLPVGGFDFERIPVEKPQTREVQVEVKEWCTVTVQSNLPGLRAFPTTLSPGPHTLTLEFDPANYPPGTRLDGSICLQGESEDREIHVRGQLELPVAPVVEASLKPSIVVEKQLDLAAPVLETPLMPSVAIEKQLDLPQMEWVYQLWKESAERLLNELGDVEGKHLIAQEKADRKNQRLERRVLDYASNLLFDLVGRKACLWYVRRLRVNERFPDEEVWELMLASDGPNFPLMLAERKKTLRLECRVHHEGKGTLKISALSLQNEDRGVENLVSLPALVRLAPSVPGYTGVSPHFIEQIQSLPIKSADEVNVDQLQGWQAFLEFQNDQIKKRQYWAGYSRHNYREGASRVSFFLNKDTRNGAQEPIEYKEFQELARRSRTEWLKLFETLPDPHKARKKWERRDKDVIGSVEYFQVEPPRLEVKLDQRVAERLRRGTYELPVEGFLHYEAGGDMSQTERHQEALSILKQGRATNPLLGDFFFDATRARPLEAVQQLQPADLLSGTCNNGQIAAIQMALATRDLLLIQGPPGTGKTTVIAEICYQVALHGGRTLIASQSNLAVDNALGRIIHSPHVRALRKGNPETVEDEGRAYTEEYVVQKWLNNTANDCRSRLAQRQQNIALFRRLLGESERFVRYHLSEVSWANRRYSAQRKYKAVLQESNDFADLMPQKEEEAQKYAPLHKIFSAIISGTIDWSMPEVSKALAYLLAETADRRQFIGRINDGLRIARQVGLTPSSEGQLLRCAVWLKEIAHTHNQSWTQSRQLIEQVEGEITLLEQLDQQRQTLAASIQTRKGHVQDLTTQIDALRAPLQQVTSEMRTLQRATNVLSQLPEHGAGSIVSFIQARIDAEQRTPSTGSGAFSLLEIAEVFPAEVLAAVQRDSSANFIELWRSAKRVVQGNIQKTQKEGDTYRQICDRLALSGRSFSQALFALPEMYQELARVQPDGYVANPQDNANFEQIVSRIQSNLQSIEEMRAKPAGLMSAFFKEREKQRLLKLFLETRELLLAANKGQQNIPGHIYTAHTEFVAKIVVGLCSSLQQHISKQQQEVEAAHQAARAKREHRETERQKLQSLLEDEEAQVSQTMRAVYDHTRQLAYRLQELSKCPYIPPGLRKIAQQNVLPNSNPLSFVEEYRRVSQSWLSDLQALETLVNELWQELEAAHNTVQPRFAQVQAALVQGRQRLRELEAARKTLEGMLGQDSPDLLAARRWWRSVWESIPTSLRPLEPPEGIFNLALLEAVEQQFAAWSDELAREEQVARRYDRLVEDWVEELRHLTDGEKRDLQEVYIRNANVIGITCGQAPKLTPKELRTFSSFDTIIIDEVSKATPPELLLPAIKGKKLILIGDRHQLPPMIEDKTLEQMAEEAKEDARTYGYLNRSYFKERYDEAPDTIKCMLSIQYRMHPDIMAAINQFYERPLECGLNQPDLERDHQLASALVRQNKHLIWVTTPLVSTQKQRSQRILVKNKASGREIIKYQSVHDGFGDASEGTSYINYREVEIIEKICEEFQQIWALKRAAGAEPKEIGVITFYAAQEKLLRQRLNVARDGKSARFDALNIRVGTVDRFQGMERAVILVSMVRNNAQRDIGFARKDERINVAFSRAQQLLVIVGCHDLFCGTARHEDAVERYKNVSKIVEKRGDFIDVSSL